MSKFNDKWAGEFDNLLDFSKDSIQMWIVDYVNINNIFYVIICKSHDEVIEIEKEIFKMKTKQEVIVPPLQDFIFYWLEKHLVVVFKTA